MKNLKVLFLAMSMITLMGVISCGSSDDPEPTQQEILVEALTSKSWSVDATTNVSGVTGAPDGTTFTVSFSDAGNGVINYTLGGDVASYLTGGSFTVAEDGSLSNLTVTSASAELNTTVQSITATETKVTIVIEATEAASRIGGVGTYTLVFTAP